MNPTLGGCAVRMLWLGLCIAPLAVSSSSYFYPFGLRVDGCFPSGLIEQNGVLYGIANAGGVSGYGVVYSLTMQGKKWTENLLWSFSGGSDGAYPVGTLTPGTNGVLYGVTQGGFLGKGTVFALAPPSSGAKRWTKTVLYVFAGGADGWGPQGSVALGSGGALYGTTYAGGSGNFGTVFQLTPNPAGGARTHTAPRAV